MDKRTTFEANSAMTPEFTNRMQHGVMSYKYKGIECLKCPMDMAIYMDVIWSLRPQTIIEFGSNAGGSALWLADVLQNFGMDKTRLISVDINPVTGVDDPRIDFRFCDTNRIEDTFTADQVRAFEKPLLVIDDASHQRLQVLNVLRFFDQVSKAGDYIIVEDGMISLVDAEDLFDYDGGPFQAIHTFMEQRGDDYEIDRSRCDYYGENVTWNLDGYIRRTG